MEQKKDSSDPSPDRESQSFKQNYAGTFVAKRLHEPEQSIDTKSETKDTEREALPMEMKVFINRCFSWLSHNHNAVTAAFTAFIFVATAAYSVFAILQWCAMRDQLKAIRQQLVGTQAANITLASPQWDVRANDLRLTLQNTEGLVSGTVTDFEARIERKRLPDESQIGEPIVIHFSDKKIVKTGTYFVDVVLPWKLPGFPEEDNPTNWPGGEVFTVNARFSYNDGFDNIIPLSYCFFYLPPYYVHTLEKNPFGFRGGGWDGSQEGCTIKAAERKFLSYKEQVEEMTRQLNQKP